MEQYKTMVIMKERFSHLRDVGNFVDMLCTSRSMDDRKDSHRQFSAIVG